MRHLNSSGTQEIIFWKRTFLFEEQKNHFHLHHIGAEASFTDKCVKNKSVSLHIVSNVRMFLQQSSQINFYHNQFLLTSACPVSLLNDLNKITNQNFKWSPCGTRTRHTYSNKRKCRRRQEEGLSFQSDLLHSGLPQSIVCASSCTELCVTQEEWIQEDNYSLPWARKDLATIQRTWERLRSI